MARVCLRHLPVRPAPFKGWGPSTHVQGGIPEALACRDRARMWGTQLWSGEFASHKALTDQKKREDHVVGFLHSRPPFL